MHVPSHVQNSFLRRKDNVPFLNKVGVLTPVYTGKKYKRYVTDTGNKLDYPIIFVNNKNASLHYGEQIVFLPHLIARIKAKGGKSKWLVMAKNISTAKARVKTMALPYNPEEIEYRETDSYKIIYCGVNPDNKKAIAKKYNQSPLSPSALADNAIEWLIENAISFDEMNLATN